MKYLAMWLFLAGVALIVFIQFISGKNINRLIQGNKQLLAEINIQNDLRKLETDVLTVESDIRGMVITNDTTRLTDVQKKFRNIETELALIQHELKGRTSKNQIDSLQSLVRSKIAFSYQILNAYALNGKDGAEAVINTERGKLLRDNINNLISDLDRIRQNELKSIISSIENTGNRARLMGFILAAIACLASIFTFLYLLNKGRQQQRMILALNASEKKIREIAQIKEQFLANMSHEIRTPMNAILGFTNLLKKSKLDSHQHQYVEYIYSSGENLLTLINDILDLSKIEAGMMNIETSPFSLNGLVSSVEIMFRDKAKVKGLDLKVNIESHIPDTLSGDAVRLTQILINLLSNAIKFTEKGFVQMNVKEMKQSAEEVELAFSVQDSGVGIVPDMRQSIFDRFQQADAETTRRFGGTGLGLSIVKQLVDLQKGSIQVNSEAGKGSEFIVTLTFKILHDNEASFVISDDVPHLAVSGQRILVAEDNIMNQQLIRHLMKQWNINYVLANNGKEAIEALKRGSFSLILMDIQMPEMDGYTATLAIRNELEDDIPIIAMTAHAMVGERERCLGYGMNDYISKPVKEAELYNILQTYAKEVRGVSNLNGQIIDLKYLKDLSAGDTEFENTIIRQFIVQMPDELQLLDEAIRVKNMIQIKGLAHGLKSTVAYMGLNDLLHSHLHRMEMESIQNEATPHFLEDLKQVKIICNQAIDEARQFLHAPAEKGDL
jgi:signal transduction histidine kinase/DNA-binding NarL/FixJ family response regulator